VDFEHIEALRNLPLHHNDPFDRLLLAQAMVERATLVTHDRALAPYDVPTLWFLEITTSLAPDLLRPDPGAMQIPIVGWRLAMPRSRRPVGSSARAGSRKDRRWRLLNASSRRPRAHPTQ